MPVSRQLNMVFTDYPANPDVTRDWYLNRVTGHVNISAQQTIYNYQFDNVWITEDQQLDSTAANVIGADKSGTDYVALMSDRVLGSTLDGFNPAGITGSNLNDFYISGPYSNGVSYWAYKSGTNQFRANYNNSSFLYKTTVYDINKVYTDRDYVYIVSQNNETVEIYQYNAIALNFVLQDTISITDKVAAIQTTDTHICIMTTFGAGQHDVKLYRKSDRVLEYTIANAYTLVAARKNTIVTYDTTTGETYAYDSTGTLLFTVSRFFPFIVSQDNSFVTDDLLVICDSTDGYLYFFDLSTGIFKGGWQIPISYKKIGMSYRSIIIVDSTGVPRAYPYTYTP